MARRGLRGLAAAGLIPGSALGTTADVDVAGKRIMDRYAAASAAPVAQPAPVVIETGESADAVHPEDPQYAVAVALNDIVDLARTLSAKGLNPGVIEMRRRLTVLDNAVLAAENAAALEASPVEGNA